MSDEQWTRARELLNDLLDADPDDRAAWLDAHCGDDSALRAEVESLLRAYEGGTLLEGENAADWLANDAAAAPDLTGQQVGPYRLTEEIGVGGMSVVYRGERTDGEFEQTVAVKLLQRRLHSGDAEQRFRAERQVLASLDHPHIASLIDGGVTGGGRPYLVMEHVEGTPLTDYAEEHDLTLDARLDLLGQVLEAVQAAHRQLVVHRDLKPSNVLVTETEGAPRVKLLDFGIAKLLDDSMPVTAPQTETGHHLMTPAYAAPEQVTGDDVTTRTDVYQLGVLAYELLSGTRPFDLSGKSLTEIERIVLEEEPAAPSTRAGEREARLQGDLDTIVAKALRKEPERRYRSVEALAADLDRHRSGAPIEARSATLGYRAKKFVRRHQWGVGVATAFLVLIAVAGTMLVRQRNRAQRNAERAQREAETAEQVSQYLVSLFESADPHLAQGDTVTARELLQEGMDRVDELNEQTAVQARMLYLLGKTRRRLGLYDSTRALLERSVRLRRQLHGPEHPTVAKSLSELALIVRENDHFAEAESLLTEAVSINRAVYGPRDSTVAAGLKNLVYVRRKTGDLEGAESAIRTALSIQRERHGEMHMSVAESLYNLAGILKDRAEYEKAERIQRKSLRMCKQLTDGPHPGTSANYNNLALLLKRQDELAKAEAMFRRTLEMNRKLYDTPHPRVATALMNLGTTLMSQGKLQQAEARLRSSLRMRRAMYDAGHSDIAVIYRSLGDLYWRKEQLDKARSMYRTSVEMYREIGMERSPAISHSLEGLGVVLQAQRKYSRAEVAYQKTLRIRQSAYSSDHPSIKELRSHLVSLYESMDRLEKAAKHRRALGKMSSGDRAETQDASSENES